MKKIFAFIKDRIIVGIVVLIPIGVVVYILVDIIKTIIKITSPLTDRISFGGIISESVIAICIGILILGTLFFIGGLLYKTYLGNMFKIWFEKKVLFQLPFFKTIQAVTKQFVGVEKSNYTSAEVDLYGNDNKLLGIITETLEDGRYVIYIPFAPILNIGHVHIVAKENVKILDLSIKDMTDIIGKIGFESNKIFKGKRLIL